MLFHHHLRSGHHRYHGTVDPHGCEREFHSQHETTDHDHRRARWPGFTYFAGRGPSGGRHGYDDAFGDYDGPPGGGRRRGGRMFGHGDLRLLLLSLIEQQPRHGYELIRIIGDMFNGQYTPSPGTVYPTLSLLEDMGHAEVKPDAGNRKLYAITKEGRAFLEDNRDAVEAVTAQTERSARRAAKMAAPENVRGGMHAIKHALLMRATGWTRTEAQRVAKILQHAAAEIASGKTVE